MSRKTASEIFKGMEIQNDWRVKNKRSLSKTKSLSKFLNKATLARCARLPNQSPDRKFYLSIGCAMLEYNILQYISGFVSFVLDFFLFLWLGIEIMRIGMANSDFSEHAGS